MTADLARIEEYEFGFAAAKTRLITPHLMLLKLPFIFSDLAQSSIFVSVSGEGSSTICDVISGRPGSNFSKSSLLRKPGLVLATPFSFFSQISFNTDSVYAPRGLPLSAFT